MAEIACCRCHKLFAGEPEACITGSIMGDECTDCYYWCAVCNVYTVRLYRDAFSGEETASDSEPIPKEEGDRRVRLIRSCAEPWDKSCRCEGHRGYFGDSLD